MYTFIYTSLLIHTSIYTNLYLLLLHLYLFYYWKSWDTLIPPISFQHHKVHSTSFPFYICDAHLHQCDSLLALCSIYLITFSTLPYLISNKSPDPARWLPGTLQANWISGLQMWLESVGQGTWKKPLVQQQVCDWCRLWVTIHWTWVHLITPAKSISTNSGRVSRGSLS